MVRELRSAIVITRGELAGVPTEEQKALSRKLEEMIEKGKEALSGAMNNRLAAEAGKLTGANGPDLAVFPRAHMSGKDLLSSFRNVKKGN